MRSNTLLSIESSMRLLKRVDTERVYSGPHVYKIRSRSSVPKHNLHYYKTFWFQGIPPSVHCLAKDVPSLQEEDLLIVCACLSVCLSCPLSHYDLDGGN